MIPINSSFRRLLKKHLPKDNSTTIDEYDNHLAFIHHLSHAHQIARFNLQRNTNIIQSKYAEGVQEIISLSEGNNTAHMTPEQIESVKRAIIATQLERAGNKLLAENKLDDYNLIRNLWFCRKKFALEQGLLLQIPSSKKHAKRFIAGLVSYWWAMVRLFIFNIKHPSFLSNSYKSFVSITLAVLFLLYFLLSCNTIDIYTDAPLYFLNKRLTSQQGKVDSQNILIELNNHYLAMPVDSAQYEIYRKAKRSADQPIKNNNLFDKIRPRINTYQNGQKFFTDNPYLLADHLNDVQRLTLIAKIQGASLEYQSLLTYGQQIAEKIGQLSGNPYWNNRFWQIDSYSADQAMNWLCAYFAERASYSLSSKNFKKAEAYGASALQFLSKVPDSRLQLDIMQRLFIILYRSRELYDLAFLVARDNIACADSINYISRATGLIYNYGEAFLLAGKINASLIQFQKSFEYSKLLPPGAAYNYYHSSSLIGVARANWHLGQYQEALELCNQLDSLTLGPRQRLVIHTTRGMIYRAQRRFDLALQSYETALQQTEASSDHGNQIIILRNIGTMYHRLQEYQKAQDYFSQALESLEQYLPDNNEAKIKLMVSLGELYIDMNQLELCDRHILLASLLLPEIGAPRVKAEFLRSFGRLKAKLNKDSQAEKYYYAALKTYRTNDLLREAIETEIDLIKLYQATSDFNSANTLLEKILRKKSNEIDLIQKFEAYGIKAEIAFEQGQLESAISASELLIDEVVASTNSINQLNFLLPLNQKIYRYLKNAAIFELKRGHLQKAFYKLDMIKALGVNKSYFAATDSANLKLKTDSLVSVLGNGILLNYLIGDSTLYVFALSKNGIELFQKNIPKHELNAIISKCISKISNSDDLFAKADFSMYPAYFRQTISDLKLTTQLLLGWPDLRQIVINTEKIYIIPDETLYQIPFGCLIPDSSKNVFWVEQSNVNILNSTNALFESMSGSRFNINDSSTVLVCSNNKFSSTGSLVKNIRELFPKTKAFDVKQETVDKATVMASLENSREDIIIFWGHSKPNLIDPQLSTFEISVSQSNLDFDRISFNITLADLQKMNWKNTKLVLLIGCETASGKHYKSSGIASFQQILSCRGAANIIGSLWPVDAEEANIQTISILEYLKKQHSPSGALRQVQIDRINYFGAKNSVYQDPHPYLWAGLTLRQTSN